MEVLSIPYFMIIDFSLVLSSIITERTSHKQKKELM